MWKTDMLDQVLFYKLPNKKGGSNFVKKNEQTTEVIIGKYSYYVYSSSNIVAIFWTLII